VHKNATLDLLAILGGTRYMYLNSKSVLVFDLSGKLCKLWKSAWYFFSVWKTRKKWLLPPCSQNFPGPPYNQKVKISILRCLLNLENSSLCKDFSNTLLKKELQWVKKWVPFDPPWSSKGQCPNLILIFAKMSPFYYHQIKKWPFNKI